MTHRRALTVTAAVVAGAALVTVAGIAIWHYASPAPPAVAAVEAGANDGIIAVTGAVRGRAAFTVTPLVATTACPSGPGHLYTRTANLYTDPGTEGALITRIAATLPASYRPGRANPLGLPVAPLTASAGTGVTLTVQVISPGWLSATTATDCRSGPAAAAAEPAGTGTPPSAIASYYAALGTRLDSSRTDTLPCSAGAITTTSAVSAQTDPTGIPARLAGSVPAGAHRVGTPGNRIIWYAADGTSTVVSAADDGTHVTAQVTTDTC